jgi:hypothetical protein
MDITTLQIAHAIRKGKKLFIPEDIPINKLHAIGERLLTHYLPAIERKSGKESEDYLFFNDMLDCLVSAIQAQSGWHHDRRRLDKAVQENLILRENNAYLNRELSSFATERDVWLRHALSMQEERAFDKIGKGEQPEQKWEPSLRPGLTKLQAEAGR